jgi:glycosyltransferase involved in cell wall biosynthesis
MKLLLIFPCYNEEAVLPDSFNKITIFFKELISEKLIDKDSKICFVDDGSKDKTWEIISSLKNEYVTGIKLSNNFGHQNALLAGLESFKNKFDAYITMDVDLQDDIFVIKQMISEYNKGNNIVYGVRNDRSTDSFFKKTTARIFYKIMLFLGVNSIPDHADFRLIDNKALLQFLQFTETHLFMRAIFPAIGLKHSKVYYKRRKREYGETKYPLKKMLSFAWDGITSFSAKPLKIVLLTGIITIFISIILFLWASIQLISGKVVTGWFSTITLIIFFGGLQTFALGIIGEYIGKIFMQTKNRPRYLIDSII